MKIFLLLRHNPYYKSSASSNRILTLIESLADNGAQITLLITDGKSSKGEMFRNSYQSYHNKILIIYISKFSNITLWNRRFYTYIFKPFFGWTINKRLNRFFKGQTEGIIWSSTFLDHLDFTLKTIKKYNRFNFFIEMSEFLDIHQMQKVAYSDLKNANKRYNMFYDKILPCIDGMAIMTITLMQHFQDKGFNNKKLIHLPMTVDLKRFNPEIEYPRHPELSERYILFVGIMNNHKDGVNILIDAFAKIANKYRDINLYLFGFWYYDVPSQLKQIKDHGLENRIFYKGTIDSSFIPNVIMNAELLVLPRPDSKQAQGGFPTKLGEYLASSKPICATKVGEIPNYLNDGYSVYFSEPGSVNSFAQAMDKALSNPDEAKSIGLRGREVAEKHFNMNNQGKLLYDFLSSLNN